MTESALWDVISAFYYVRTQPLIVGQTVYLNVFDSNKFLTVEVNVLAKEKVSLSDGSGSGYREDQTGPEIRRHIPEKGRYPDMAYRRYKKDPCQGGDGSAGGQSSC